MILRAQTMRDGSRVYARLIDLDVKPASKQYQIVPVDQLRLIDVAQFGFNPA